MGPGSLLQCKRNVHTGNCLDLSSEDVFLDLSAKIEELAVLLGSCSIARVGEAAVMLSEPNDYALGIDSCDTRPAGR